MHGGVEVLFWLCFGALILVALVIASIGEWLEGRKPDVLPPPRMDRIARGGRDHWIVSEVTRKE